MRKTALFAGMLAFLLAGCGGGGVEGCSGGAGFEKNRFKKPNMD